MKTLVTKYQSQVTAFLWRQFLRIAGDVVAAAEDWIHAQELKLRAPAPARTVVTDEFQIAVSRARERAIKKDRTPRLRYQAGQFVRENRSCV